MTVLLLPRLGVSNAVPFNNNFVVSKDGNPWSDGGADTFDWTTGVQVNTPNGWLMLGGNAYTSADGLIQTLQALGAGAVGLGIYAGWAVAGIFACGAQCSCQQSFMALGQAKVSLLLACLRKIVLLIPLILILPHVLPFDPVFSVFLAEPVSDIAAANGMTVSALKVSLLRMRRKLGKKLQEEKYI